MTYTEIKLGLCKLNFFIKCGAGYLAFHGNISTACPEFTSGEAFNCLCETSARNAKLRY